MKILYYNWVDYLDPEHRGGGVTVYQRNVMQALATVSWAQATFVSSGLSYDLHPGAPRWDQARHGPDQDRSKRFEIVNSGTPAPAHHSFGNPAQLDDPATRAVFFDFIEKTGPYDVIHFNNLEGLPANVLSLKERWPDTKVILSLHNYYPICPQVNLWYQERAICRDFDQGRKCADCLIDKRNPQMLRLSGAMAYRLKRAGINPGTWLFDTGFRWALQQGARGIRIIKKARGGLKRSGQTNTEPPVDPAPQFAHRRRTMIDLINDNCDRVLCVSNAVRDVGVGYGLCPDLASTSYIGTPEAARWDETAPLPSMLGDDGTLTLAYLGYMRRDKGFFFLLDALEGMADEAISRLRLVVAARHGDLATMARLDRLGARMAGFEYHDGYTHDGLDAVLRDVGIGVIPVLWHDNLPQVALEIHARHIPLLTSDLGGAQELGDCPDLVFEAGNKHAFAQKIEAILDGTITPSAYWASARTPTTTQMHLAELRQHYAGS